MFYDLFDGFYSGKVSYLYIISRKKVVDRDGVMFFGGLKLER